MNFKKIAVPIGLDRKMCYKVCTKMNEIKTDTDIEKQFELWRGLERRKV